MTNNTKLVCDCGQVTLSVQGDHILSAECLCADCQKAGAELQTLPNGKAVVDNKGATRFVLYRKDRVRCEQGQSLLHEHRLTADSKTRRVVATCCNTPMFLEFTQGHWLSLYGDLWPPEAIPPLEMRTVTKETPPGVVLPDDVPNLKTHSFRFFVRLLGAWAAMGFRTPKIDYVEGKLDAHQ